MQDQPSRTAMGSAVLRADHVHEDAPPWVLEDSLSEQLLDRRSRDEVRAEIARWALFDAAALKERYFPHRRDLRLPDSTLLCVAQV